LIKIPNRLGIVSQLPFNFNFFISFIQFDDLQKIKNVPEYCIQDWISFWPFHRHYKQK